MDLRRLRLKFRTWSHRCSGRSLGRCASGALRLSLPLLSSRSSSEGQASSYDKSGLTELEKPLRPIFVSPSIDLGQFEREPFTDFLPIVCVSASKQIKAQDDSWRIGGWTYIQGAGDE